MQPGGEGRNGGALPVLDKAVLALGRHRQRKGLHEAALGQLVPGQAQPRQRHALAGEGRGEGEAEVDEAIGILDRTAQELAS